MFKRFKRKEESPKHVDQTDDNDEENSGFICPVCYWGFLSADDLQTHWEKHCQTNLSEKSQNTSELIKNEEDTPNVWKEQNGSSHKSSNSEEISLLDATLKDLEEKSTEVVALQQEINDINAALKEEKWYTSALKQEVDKLESEKQERLLAYQDLEQEKHQMLMDIENKLKKIEQEKNSEINVLKENLVNALEAKSGSQEEQLSLVQKSSKINTELVEIQSQLKDTEEKRKVLEKLCDELKVELEEKHKFISDLESDIANRPTAEHVSSLQKHVTSLEAQLKTIREEKDAERIELNEKLHSTAESNKRLEARVNELTIEKTSKVEQLQSLQTAIDASTDYRKQVEESQKEKHQMILNLQHELDQTIVAVKEKEQFVEFLQKQLNETKQNYQVELNGKDEARQEVRRLQNTLEEQDRLSAIREMKLSELIKSLEQAKLDVERMEEERNDLIGKIEAGEGINTAINQLNQEKDQLEERLKNNEALLKSQSEENLRIIEDLHKRTNELIEEVERYKQDQSKMSVHLKEKNDEIGNLSHTLNEVKSQLQIKTELFVALEASKITERKVLEEERMLVEEKLQQKIDEHSSSMNENHLINEELSSLKNENTNLKSQVLSLKSQVDGKNEQYEELKTELLDKENSILRIENEKQKLIGSHETLLCEKNNEIVKLKEQFDQLTTEHEVKTKHLEESKSQLVMKMNVQLATLKEKEDELKTLKADITALIEEKGALQERLDTNIKLLDERSSELKKKSEEFEISKELLDNAENTKEELKNQISELMSSLMSVKEKLNVSETKLLEMKTEVETHKAQLDEVMRDKCSVEEERRGDAKIHKEEIEKHQKEAKNYNDIVEKKNEEIDELRRVIDRKDELLQEHRQKIEAQEVAMKKMCESCKDYDNKLCRSQELLNQEKQIVEEKNKEIIVAKQMNEELVTRISLAEEEKKLLSAEANESQENLRNEINNLSQEKLELEKKLSEQSLLLEETQLAQELLIQDKGKIQEDLRQQENEWNELKANMQGEITLLQREVDDEKRKRLKIVEETSEKEKVFIDQKLLLQNQLEHLQINLQKVKEDSEENREASKRAQGILKTEMDNLDAKLQNEKNINEQLTTKLGNTESRLNTKLAAANENLVSARNEIGKCEEKIVELEKVIKQKETQQFDLKGEIAVLEATIENNHDEKRSLLERCISAEDSCKKHLKTIEQLNKNVDELNSAMVELGQENQNLQVEQNIRNNRKWEKDNDVVQCNACAKKFSVSVRKHHCRNCGAIFCSECTSKTATVAGSKKPARVCDSCFNDLNVPVRVSAR